MSYHFTVSNSLDRVTVNVGGEKTIRQLFEENNIALGGRSPSINGKVVDDIDATIDSLNLDPDGSYRVMAVVKGENAAKAVIRGSVVVIESAMSLEDLKKICKYKPNATKLYDEDKELVYEIGVSGDRGSINKWSADFSDKFTTKDGKATITVDMTAKVTDPVACVQEAFGTALYNLNKIEETLPGALNEIDAVLSQVRDAITVE